MEIAHDVATGGTAKVWLAVRTTPNIMLRALPGGFPSDFIASPLYDAPDWFADAMAELGRRISIGDLTNFGLPSPRRACSAAESGWGACPRSSTKRCFLQSVID